MFLTIRTYYAFDLFRNRSRTQSGFITANDITSKYRPTSNLCFIRETLESFKYQFLLSFMLSHCQRTNKTNAIISKSNIRVLQTSMMWAPKKGPPDHSMKRLNWITVPATVLINTPLSIASVKTKILSIYSSSINKWTKNLWLKCKFK